MRHTGYLGLYVCARAGDAIETAETAKIAKASMRIRFSIAYERDRTAIPPRQRPDNNLRLLFARDEDEYVAENGLRGPEAAAPE